MSAVLAGTAALLLAHSGFAALALAMDRHYRAMQATPRGCPRRLRLVLRAAGTFALAASLGAALQAWPPASGAVAWFGLLSVAALALVLLLAVRTRAALAGAVAATFLGLITQAAALVTAMGH